MRVRKKPPVGSSPGTLAIDAAGHEPRITAIVYDAAHDESFEVARVADLAPLKGRPGTLWVDVQGLNGEATLRALGDGSERDPIGSRTPEIAPGAESAGRGRAI